MAVSAVDKVEIRGPVATVEDGAVYTWGPQEFAGFYYDIDDNIGQESITLSITGGNVLDEPNGIKYETTAQKDTFDFDEWGEFWTIGFLADEYFAAYVEGGKEDAYLYYDSTDRNLMVDEQLSKVLIDDDEERTFTTGTPLELEEDYELAIQAIDLDGNKVYVQLMKDGAVVDSAVVEPSKDGAGVQDKTYTYKKWLGDTEKIVVIAVHFKNAFRGTDQDLATVDGIWQISDVVTDVEEDTEYDKMTVQTVNSAEPMSITMDNEDNKITLSKNKDQLLMQNIRIKTADQDVINNENPLRFYIYEEAVIEAEEEEAAPAPVEAPVAEEPVAEEPVAEEPVAEEPVAEEP
ncbi:MAG TPA: S-layer protein domain-containing protein, partial [Methanothrix sp.]|nr:S-layer protein domain-containing protein [Methanothrix sp.]